jgi:hypothetical protein
LACAQYGSRRSDPAYVDQGLIVVELSMIMTCSTSHILWYAQHLGYSCMGNDNHGLGVERWQEYCVTHFCESVTDERHSKMGTVLLGSAGPVPV